MIAILTDRALQAASAILHKANRTPSKELFLKECLEIPADLFDCAVVRPHGFPTAAFTGMSGWAQNLQPARIMRTVQLTHPRR
ncbi:MAG: hypothetical protein ABIJ52_06435 [Pseudomonadota bacterium]